ncbi:HPr family phosphocarrier protein [Segnochrobactrum spirostomi]|uniref:HPr family phosphocarrier protein n=1 Tax=Segnochrobactrum spirostomi TaxID=2608987 RepID=A0A6A7Y2S3_9HYPH|nr:HPr family phosphocarrier protein [Segnochrobactrum spirostomi]MQT12667.1 HPr family phosphocarrier protein [Segnochrobactrum spirostomi]
MPVTDSSERVRDLAIVNRRGLHARAAAKFARLVEMFEAEVRVGRDDQEVGGTSIMGLLMLAAGPGTTISVRACGPQADAVLEALESLVSHGFGESD